MVEVRCKTCDQGVLSLRKVYRMSGPVVTIGYILLIPSILGLLLSVVFFVLTLIGAASAAERRLTDTTVHRMRDTAVPAELIAKLQDGSTLSSAERHRLNSEQAAAVSVAESELAAHAAATGCFGACGTGMAGITAAVSFIGGLIGWLLVMKKRVLFCPACTAVTPAR